MNTTEHAPIVILNSITVDDIFSEIRKLHPDWDPNTCTANTIATLTLNAYRSICSRNRPESSASNDTAFGKGVRAVFDYFHYRAANNYHANPKIQLEINKENSVVLRWVNDALEEISEKDYKEWISIKRAYDDGFAAGQKAAVVNLSGKKKWYNLFGLFK